MSNLVWIKDGKTINIIDKPIYPEEEIEKSFYNTKGILQDEIVWKQGNLSETNSIEGMAQALISLNSMSNSPKRPKTKNKIEHPRWRNPPCTCKTNYN